MNDGGGDGNARTHYEANCFYDLFREHVVSVAVQNVLCVKNNKANCGHRRESRGSRTRNKQKGDIHCVQRQHGSYTFWLENMNSGWFRCLWVIASNTLIQCWLQKNIIVLKIVHECVSLWFHPTKPAMFVIVEWTKSLFNHDHQGINLHLVLVACQIVSLAALQLSLSCTRCGHWAEHRVDTWCNRTALVVQKGDLSPLQLKHSKPFPMDFPPLPRVTRVEELAKSCNLRLYQPLAAWKANEKPMKRKHARKPERPKAPPLSGHSRAKWAPPQVKHSTKLVPRILGAAAGMLISTR